MKKAAFQELLMKESNVLKASVLQPCIPYIEVST